MTFRDRIRSSPFGLGTNRASDSDALNSLKRAIKHERTRLEAAERPLEVQLLGQVTPAGEWPRLCAYWERRNPGGVAAWPRRLQPDEHALNLWPLQPGGVPSATGVGGDVRQRQPKKMLCPPGLTIFSPSTGATAEMALAVVVTTWLGDIGADFPALRIAPPVLEVWTPGGRLFSRQVVDFGLEWLLPPADLR